MPDNHVPAAAGQQCWCCAFYGLHRAAVSSHGLCLLCACLPGMCEAGHRLAARHEEADGA